MNPNEFGEPLTFDLVDPTVSLTAATLGYNRGREKKMEAKSHPIQTQTYNW